MILVSLSHSEKLSAFDNILLGGYTDDKNQMVLIKVFGEAFDQTSKVSKHASTLELEMGFSDPKYHKTFE